MTALPVSEEITNDNKIKFKMTINTVEQKIKTIDDKNDCSVEEALECTAVISPSATTVATSTTSSDEFEARTAPQENIPVRPQSHLLSLNDGPSNHQVQVNYVATNSDAKPEQEELRIHRRSKSTGNIPNNSSLKKMDTTFSEWMDTSSNTYSCDVGNSIQAFTTIAFPGSSSEITTTKGLENDDETSSLGSSSSVAYFEPSDFDSSTWRDVVWNHASTTAFGIVTIVALATTAIAHPIFFLAASAIAAVGTISASISHRNSTSSSPSPSDIVANIIDKNQTEDNNIDTSSVASTTESTWSTWPCFNNPFQNIDDDALNGTMQTAIAEQIPESAEATTVGEPKSVSRLMVEPSSTIRRKLTKDDQNSWVQKNFPRLCHRVGPVKNGAKNNSASSCASLVGLNAMDCFRVFFDDSAPYNFMALQEKRGDLHIHYGLWDTLPMTGKISMFDHIDSMPFPVDVSLQSYRGRLLTFHAKTNAMFGPPYAKTTKTQKFLLVNRRLAILESKTTLSGIPFSDRFYVGERWIFVAEKVHDKHYVTHVHVDCEVFFHSGSCPFEQQIKSKSMSTINDVVSSWCIMAVEALKLTELAKLHRLQQTMDYGADDDETVDETVTIENVEADANHDWNRDDSIEVVADASLLSTRISPTTNRRPPRSTLRHFGRHRHSFDDDQVAAK